MNKVYKSILSVSAAAIVATATLTPAFVSAGGDSAGGRRSYTNAEITRGDLGDTITFNSISDSKIGDEKNFVGAKVAGAKVTKWNADEIDVVDGQTYTIRLYVHNNSTKKTAEGVVVSYSLPTTVAKEHTIIGYIDAKATPNRYWDEVTLKSNEDFYLEYVPGSAQYNNKDDNGNERSFKLPDEVIVGGAKVGYNSMDGYLPGCYEYSGVATINVVVHKANVSSKLATQVRIKGTKDWKESVDAKVGDEVEYQIAYENLGADQVNNVMIRDILPTNVEYVANSTVLYNSNYKDGVKIAENTLTTSGINIGSYAARGTAYVRFTGKVVNKTLACGNNQLVNWASATVNGKVYKDDASVMVQHGTCPAKIVNTGAGSVAGIALGAGSLVTALGYAISSRKKLM